MRRPLARQLWPVAVLSVAVFAVCAWPAWAWDGSQGLAALGLAAGICMLAAALARVASVTLQTLDSRDEAGPQAIQASVGIRLLLTLAASLPVLLLKPVPQLQFVVWLGANYMAHLVLEVFVSLRDLGQNHGPTQGAGPPHNESHNDAQPAPEVSDRPTRDPPSPGADQE